MDKKIFFEMDIVDLAFLDGLLDSYIKNPNNIYYFNESRDLLKRIRQAIINFETG